MQAGDLAVQKKQAQAKQQLEQRRQAEKEAKVTEAAEYAACHQKRLRKDASRQDPSIGTSCQPIPESTQSPGPADAERLVAMTGNDTLQPPQVLV